MPFLSQFKLWLPKGPNWAILLWPRVKPGVGSMYLVKSPAGGDTKNSIVRRRGLFGTYLSFTPSCTGGHNCINPAILRDRLLRVYHRNNNWIKNQRPFSLKSAWKRKKIKNLRIVARDCKSTSVRKIKPSGSLENPKVKKSPVNGALNLIE